MPVYSEHPDYRNINHKWKLVRKIVHNEAHDYIYPYEQSTEYQKRVYKDQGYLVNFTDLTRIGLVGLVFKKDSNINLPDTLDYLKTDVNGTGLDITQFSQHGISELLQTGRLGLMVDYPKRESVVSKFQQEQGELKARIVPYMAENIINWKTQKIGSKTKLSMVVLRELVDEIGNDGYAWEEKEYYRVLSLDDSGEYIQFLTDKFDNIIEDPIKPLDAKGKPFTELPFIFVGAQNNDWVIDPIPLYDIARINLQHYRNSCDLEENIRIHGQATLVLGGDMDIESFREAYGDTLALGVGQAYYLGSSPYAQLLQAGPNQMVSQEMKRKEEQAASLGARLIAPPGGRETAEGARIRYGSANSSLHILVSNMSKAMVKALGFCALFMGAESENIAYELNRKFYDEKADPNLIAQQMIMLQNGVIAKEDVRDYLRDTNVLSDIRSDSDIESDIEVEFDPLEGVDDESRE